MVQKGPALATRSTCESESKNASSIEDDGDDDEVGLACLVQGVSLVRALTSLSRRARVCLNASSMSASGGEKSVPWGSVKEPAMAGTMFRHMQDMALLAAELVSSALRRARMEQ